MLVDQEPISYQFKNVLRTLPFVKYTIFVPNKAKTDKKKNININILLMHLNVTKYLYNVTLAQKFFYYFSYALQQSHYSSKHIFKSMD